MDFRIKHWRGYPRRFTCACPIASADWVPRKGNWVHHAFDTCNFSLILRGRGRFERFGRSWEIAAPCVITQWPGERVDYGPELPAETWDEVYVIYDATLMPRLEAAGLIDRERPVWAIHDLPRVSMLITEFSGVANSARPESVVDRADHLMERIILETLLAPMPFPGGDTGVEPVQKIITLLHRDFAQPVNFDELAKRHGLARATFRRRWAELLPQPPARYLLELRMREACRLLAETTRPVRQIAGEVGFPDELYFSRRFHLEQGLPPREYRRIYALRMPPATASVPRPPEK